MISFQWFALIFTSSLLRVASRGAPHVRSHFLVRVCLQVVLRCTFGHNFSSVSSQNNYTSLDPLMENPFHQYFSFNISKTHSQCHIKIVLGPPGLIPDSNKITTSLIRTVPHQIHQSGRVAATSLGLSGLHSSSNVVISVLSSRPHATINSPIPLKSFD